MGEVIQLKGIVERAKEVTKQLDFFDYLYLAVVFMAYIAMIWALTLVTR